MPAGMQRWQIRLRHPYGTGWDDPDPGSAAARFRERCMEFRDALEGELCIEEPQAYPEIDGNVHDICVTAVTRRAPGAMRSLVGRLAALHGLDVRLEDAGPAGKP